jgi:hypothetical protein
MYWTMVRLQVPEPEMSTTIRLVGFVVSVVAAVAVEDIVEDKVRN